MTVDPRIPAVSRRSASFFTDQADTACTKREAKGEVWGGGVRKHSGGGKVRQGNRVEVPLRATIDGNANRWRRMRREEGGSGGWGCLAAI